MDGCAGTGLSSKRSLLETGQNLEDTEAVEYDASGSRGLVSDIMDDAKRKSTEETTPEASSSTQAARRDTITVNVPPVVQSRASPAKDPGDVNQPPKMQSTVISSEETSRRERSHERSHEVPVPPIESDVEQVADLAHSKLSLTPWRERYGVTKLRSGH